MRDCIVLIPALHPDKRLIGLVLALKAAEFTRIVVIDDGSGSGYRKIFAETERLGCMVARHEKNRGKGAAFKTGIHMAMECYGKGNAYVTADADGQHLPEDVCRVADALVQHSDMLVLGIRDFGSGNVPWRSRFGNWFSSGFFRLVNGIICPDTQTGLRGIPACLEGLAASEDGERYEYEMNFLSDAAGQVPFYFVPVQTVYEEGNVSSHFRPVIDSIRVYGRFLRFAAASLAGAVMDYLFFFLALWLLALPQEQEILLATVFARLASGGFNFWLNRIWSFRSRQPAYGEAVRYAVLFVGQMGASALLVMLLTRLLLPAFPAKLLVDTTLFIFSFIIQKKWVFRKEAVQ